jgi:hypothetical protein
VPGLLAAAIIFAAAASAHADDCPGGATSARAFILERGDSSKISVLHLADGIVRMIYRFRGSTVLETTEFQGLFPIERIDRGRRRTFRAKTDLKTLLPLRVGKKIVAKFDTEESGQASTATFELLPKKTDALYIGSCKYPVFQIEKSEGRAERAPQFINNDYYAADLKIIIAKEYKEQSGATTWVKYDKIYPER